jgi:hypothetical protein
MSNTFIHMLPRHAALQSLHAYHTYRMSQSPTLHPSTPIISMKFDSCSRLTFLSFPRLSLLLGSSILLRHLVTQPVVLVAESLALLLESLDIAVLLR